MNWLRIVVLLCALGGALPAVHAADMAQPTPLPKSADTKAIARQYLEGRATLLLLRARFDDISADAIPGLLATDAGQVAKAGPSVEALADLESNLVAEGSYYIVSLTYLTRSGGALWPTDRPEANYRRDALARLQDLQAELFAVAENHTDPLPIFLAVDQINAWTEGYAEVPPGLDHFKNRDALVDAALAAAKPVGI